MVIDDLTRQLPHFEITCLVKPEMNIFLSFPLFNVCQYLISLLVNYFVVIHVFYVQLYCTIVFTMLSADGNFN
jgi:hypothetical protein